MHHPPAKSERDRECSRETNSEVNWMMLSEKCLIGNERLAANLSCVTLPFRKKYLYHSISRIIFWSFQNSNCQTFNTLTQSAILENKICSCIYFCHSQSIQEQLIQPGITNLSLYVSRLTSKEAWGCSWDLFIYCTSRTEEALVKLFSTQIFPKSHVAFRTFRNSKAYIFGCRVL